MTADDFRRIALSFAGSEESSHMGSPDFRVGGRIFATLAAQSKGYGNLMFDPALQAAFIGAQPDLFLPIPGGWGRQGMTHVRLTPATENHLHEALQAAWKHRLEKNQQSKPARKKRRS